MARRLPARVLGVLAALTIGAVAVQGCTLAVDADELQAGDEALGCTTSEKVCHNEDGRGYCADLNSVTTGCGDPRCNECVLTGVQTYRCNDEGECIKNQCKPGWADCDDDGRACEVETNDDILNCGFCNVECSRVNSFNDCVNGVCVLSGCSPGYRDCDDDARNGCETMTGESVDPQDPDAMITNPCPEE